MGSRVCDIKKKFEGLSESSKDFLTNNQHQKLDNHKISRPNVGRSTHTSPTEPKPVVTPINLKGNIKRSHAFRTDKNNRNLQNDSLGSILNLNPLHATSISLRTEDGKSFGALTAEPNSNIVNKVYHREIPNSDIIDKATSKNANKIQLSERKTLIKSNNFSNAFQKQSENGKTLSNLASSKRSIDVGSTRMQICLPKEKSSLSTLPKISRPFIDIGTPLNEQTENNRTDNNSNSNINSDTSSFLSLSPQKLPLDKPSLEESSISNSLKKVLKSPLPSGPPPKKPPRTFAHTIDLNDSIPDSIANCSRPGVNYKSDIDSSKPNYLKTVVKPIRSKTESQIMLKKLEMVLNNHQSQRKVNEPKIKVLNENTNKCDTNGKSVPVNNIAGTDQLTIVRKSSLPDTPSSDNNSKENGGCFGVLSCSNSMELLRSSHIYDLPLEPKSHFYIDTLKNSSAHVNRGLTKENNLENSGHEIVTKHAIEPVYAKPQAKNKRKPPINLQNVSLSNVPVPLSNKSMGIMSENSNKLNIKSYKPNNGFEKNNSSLHYMSSPILEHQPFPTTTVPQTPSKENSSSKKNLFDNSNTKTFPGRSGSFDLEFLSNMEVRPGNRSLSLDFSPDVDNERIQKMVNDVYSKCLSMPQDSDSESIASTPDESGPKLPPEKPAKPTTSEEALRERLQRTAERKIYLKRVCSRATSFHRPSISYPNLFEYLLLIGLDLNTASCKVPYVKFKYPEDADVPKGIEQLCFPDASDWPPQACADESGISSCYCIVITHSSGSRKYGYCRRVQPEGAPICLPLAYCIVSSYKANRYFGQVLAELESRHGQPDHIMSKFIQNLHQCPFPAPGKGLLVINPVTGEMNEMLTRALDPRQEEMDLARLLNIVRYSVFLQMFVTLLLERKVVLLSYSISKLSTCVEGLCAAIYPFHWQHTLVPIVPSTMLDLCQAPTPFIIGLLKPRDPKAGPPNFPDHDQVLVVDVDECRTLQCNGDEGTVLPARLSRGLREAMQCAVPDKNSSLSPAHNLVASEALMGLFVQLVGHYRNHILTCSNTGERKFQREAFVKSVSSNTVQNFLDWFSETAMFNAFIESRLDRTAVDTSGLFEQRSVEHLSQCQAPTKGYLNKTVKIFGNRIKGWANSS